MKKNYLLITFIVALIGLTVFDVITTDREFSDVENRKLNQKVKFSLEGFLDGSFQKDYEKYVNDQFIQRDLWIDIKSRGEFALGKIENNGIILGEDKYLFDKFTKVNEERVENNTNALNIFIENNDERVSLMIIPNSYEIYKEKLPTGSPVINQEEAIDKIYDSVKNANNVEVLDMLNENKDDYIYYRTDHHWTTYGAYLAYEKYMKSIGETPISIKEMQGIELDGFYGTYFSKAKPFNVPGDELTYYEMNNRDMVVDGKEFESMYDLSKSDIRDKYSLFLNGNNGLTIIKNKELNNGKKILVLKDSFGNSFAPFLTANFEEVHLVDLRHYQQFMSIYTKQNEFDEILVLYNYQNFATDINLLKFKY